MRGTTVTAKTQPKIGGRVKGTTHPNPMLKKIGGKVRATSKPNVALYHSTKGRKGA